MFDYLTHTLYYTHNGDASTQKSVKYVTEQHYQLLSLYSIGDRWTAVAQTVISPSPSRPGFNPRPVHVEFVVDKVTLGHIFLEVLESSRVTIIHQCCTINCKKMESITCHILAFQDLPFCACCKITIFFTVSPCILVHWMLYTN